MCSLFKPQYKATKQFQIPQGRQADFNLFTLRHNFRVFPRGKRRRFLRAQFEGLNVSLNDWFGLLYSRDGAIPEEVLVLPGRTKEVIFPESAT